MGKNEIRPIIGGIFGTRTEWDAEGNQIKKDDFHLRLYWDLWHSGAIANMPRFELHVYLTIAMHLDQRGQGWPTQEEIAEMLKVNRKTVGAATKALEEKGYIERERHRKPDGTWSNYIYKIKFAPPVQQHDHDQKTDMDHVQFTTGGKLDTKKDIFELNTESNTVKTEYKNESSTEQQPQEKKKSISITLDEIADLELDSSFLPENFPPKFTEAVKKVRDDLETIRYYFDIARAAHKDAEKRLKEQLQDPSFEFGDTYFDDDVAAAAFLSTIGQAKLGKIEESIEAHFRGNVRSRLVRKELALMQALEKKEKQDQFVLYDWLNKE
jgi:predicted transcriptional regulator